MALWSDTTSRCLPHELFLIFSMHATKWICMKLCTALPMTLKKAGTESWLHISRGSSGKRLGRWLTWSVHCGIHLSKAQGIVFESPSLGTASLIEFKPVLGDPSARDVMLQSAQLLSPDAEYLPIRIDSIELGLQFAEPGERLSHAVQQYQDNGADLVSVVTAVDPGGKLVERLSGYVCRQVGAAPGILPAWST